MSHTAYFIEVLKSTEAIEGATYLSPEEKSVFASRLLSELKPPMMTPGTVELREIVEKRIKSFILTKEADNGSIAPLGPDVQQPTTAKETRADDDSSEWSDKTVTCGGR